MLIYYYLCVCVHKPDSNNIALKISKVFFNIFYCHFL